MNRKPRQLNESELSNQIERLLSKNPKTRYNVIQISRKINVANPPESIKNALLKLAAEKKVVKLSDDRYKWETFTAEKTGGNRRKAEDEILYTGVVDMTRSGAAYIINSESVEDIYVHGHNLKGALHKDEVTVAVSESKARRRPEGRVVSIEKRALSRVIGHIRIFNNYAILTPDNSRIYPEVLVHHNDTMTCNDNDRVVVEIISWGRGQNKALWGKVIKVLEDISDIEMNMQSILFSNGFDPEFSEEVLSEAEAMKGAITDAEIRKRRDFRDVVTFTIDPLTAKDFDDAVSYQVLENGSIEIGVHIADVTHYLQEGTALDKEALRRSTSVYLVDRVCPMLPEKLSNDLCSLNPKEDKYTFSAVFVFDKDVKIVHEWFGKTIIHSNRRFTYEEAQERIETGEGDFAEEINILNNIAKKLREERYAAGSISFESEEVQFILDEESKPTGMYVRERKEAHMLIEDFMLLANKRVATYIATKAKPEIPFIYRIHDLPNPDKLSDFALFAAELGFKFKMDKPEQIADSFNRLAIAAHDNPLLKLLEPLAIRTMAKAVYSTENIGHYGLGFEYYTHFTSPIRRYSDVLVHRGLFRNLTEVHREDKEKLELKAKHISDQEKKASESERESTKYFQTLYISAYIGQEFDGVISGIIEKGVFVELLDSKVEGLVTFDSMGDMFTVPTSRMKAKSRLSGDELTMGQKIRVRIKAADPDTRRTDMEIVI
ncbi:MAG: ribonuclease R [Saprospiraceae bacterium]|nr:ribonuclease R [Saprospiraceae bacterium]